MLVSIILPIYNVKDYLEECVGSLTDQTYKNIEILLVDDGSVDGTGELCDSLATRDDRIRVFHKENGGTHTARNLGIENAHGEYLMFIDPDDWIDSCAVEGLVSVAKSEDVDAVRCNYVREFENGSFPKENLLLEERVYEGEDCLKICRQTLGLVGEELSAPENMNFLASACFSLYRKRIIDEHAIRFINIREVATFSDGFFNINFLMYADKFRFVDKHYYHYRKFNEGAATSKYRERFLEKQLILFDRLKALISKLDNESFNEALDNRIALSVMEQCLNVFKRKNDFVKKYKEIKTVLNNEVIKAACDKLELAHFSPKWKLYYGFVKHRCTLLVYIMTYAIRYIQRKNHK